MVSWLLFDKFSICLFILYLFLVDHIENYLGKYILNSMNSARSRFDEMNLDLKLSDNIKSKFEIIEIIEIELFKKLNRKYTGSFELCVLSCLKNYTSTFKMEFKTSFNETIWKYKFPINSENNAKHLILYPEFKYRFKLIFTSKNWDLNLYYKNNAKNSIGVFDYLGMFVKRGNKTNEDKNTQYLFLNIFWKLYENSKFVEYI